MGLDHLLSREFLSGPAVVWTQKESQVKHVVVLAPYRVERAVSQEAEANVTRQANRTRSGLRLFVFLPLFSCPVPILARAGRGSTGAFSSVG